MQLQSHRKCPQGVAVTAALVAVLTTSHVHAALLGLVQQPPDITSQFILVNYASGVFDALGTPTAFDIDGVAPPDYSINSPKSFHLQASINSGTGALISGTLSITGKIPALSANSGTLLTGNLTAFGFQNSGGDIFEFKFQPTGGDLASYFGTLGGVILDAAGSNFNGSFTSSFTNDPNKLGFGVGGADTFAVPEASSICLVLASGVLSAGLIRLRKRTSPAQ